MKREPFDLLFEAWEELRQDPDKMIAYELRKMAIIDEEARIDSARHYRREKGREEGRKEMKEEIVKKLLSMGMTIEMIETASGLTEAQINKIKQQKESL